VMIIFAGTQGYLDDVPVHKIQKWEREFHRWMDLYHPEIGKRIAETKDLDEETEKALRAAIEEFKRSVII